MKHTIYLLLMLLAYSCESSLSDEEIEMMDRAAINSYIETNQLEGRFIGSDIYLQIKDSGQKSLLVDSIPQTDTLFVDTFYVDTLFQDSLIILDTIRIDTQLIEVFIPDSSFAFTFPGNQDTVILEFDLSDLQDQVLFSTQGEAFTLSSGNYPTLSRLLPGLRSGLRQLSKGGKALILVPSDQAYGRTGNANVPPHTPIRIDAHLIDFY